MFETTVPYCSQWPARWHRHRPLAPGSTTWHVNVTRPRDINELWVSKTRVTINIPLKPYWVTLSHTESLETLYSFALLWAILSIFTVFRDWVGIFGAPRFWNCQKCLRTQWRRQKTTMWRPEHSVGCLIITHQATQDLATRRFTTLYPDRVSNNIE